MGLREKIGYASPLGRAHQKLERYLEGDLSASRKEYIKAYRKYRTNRAALLGVKSLLYAGLITSVLTTAGIGGAELIAQVASYIGVTVLLVFYAVFRYLSELYREEYHVRREILIAREEASDK